VSTPPDTVVLIHGFPGRPHFPGAPGWEEVADYALTWAVEHAAAQSEAEVGG
jgi:hypothetical protein